MHLMTTRQFYAPVLSSRLKKASESLDGRFKGKQAQAEDEALETDETAEGFTETL